VAVDISQIYGFGNRGDGARRLAWSNDLEQALGWFGERCEEAGLDVHRDAAGNLIAKWQAGLGKALVVGSHLDSVPQGGAFDGVLGVASGLEAIRRLRERDVVPGRPIWLVAFMDEEGVRFGVDFFGSRSFVGEDLTSCADRRDPDGITLGEAMAEQGFPIDEVTTANAVDGVEAYVELHAELGPELRRAGVPIGVISEVFGQSLLRVTLTGTADHAAAPLADRRDALLGAGRIIARVGDLASQSGEHVATVGSIHARPGAANAIAGSCEFSIDLRARRPEVLSAATETARQLVADTAMDLRLESEVIAAVFAEPIAADPLVSMAIVDASGDLGFSQIPMASRTAHDAMILAGHVPMGMVFVRSAPIGHSPQEHCEPEDIEAGVEVLAEMLLRLTQDPGLG
jgi:hydantoinase/carbamoylase family amidase